jgi:hypothetical protein
MEFISRRWALVLSVKTFPRYTLLTFSRINKVGTDMESQAKMQQMPLVGPGGQHSLSSPPTPFSIWSFFNLGASEGLAFPYLVGDETIKHLDKMNPHFHFTLPDCATACVVSSTWVRGAQRDAHGFANRSHL